MAFVEDITRLPIVEQQQQYAKTQWAKWRHRWFELDRERKALIRKIDRATQRLLKVYVDSPKGKVSLVVSGDIMHEIEDRLNAEGVMEQLIADRFTAQAERTTGQNPWKELSERYAKRIGTDTPILIRSGELRVAAMEAVANTFKFNYEDMEWPGIEAIQQVDYAAAQNYGYAPNNLPKRPFFKKPSRAEMAPIYKRAMEIFREIQRRNAQEVEAEVVNR